MNYDEMLKQGRIEAMRKFFQQHGKKADEHYLEWFYENFLGICKNMGYLHSNGIPFSDSPYAEFALAIYDMGH